MKNKDANVKKVLAARQFGVIFWDRNGCQSKMQGMASGLSSSMVFAKFASISFALHAVQKEVQIIYLRDVGAKFFGL